MQHNLLHKIICPHLSDNNVDPLNFRNRISNFKVLRVDAEEVVAVCRGVISIMPHNSKVEVNNNKYLVDATHSIVSKSIIIGTITLPIDLTSKTDILVLRDQILAITTNIWSLEVIQWEDQEMENISPLLPYNVGLTTTNSNMEGRLKV